MGTQKTSASAVDLSVIITVHSEGILLHKTLASVRRSLALLHAEGVRNEIIIHLDNPTQATAEYTRVHKKDVLKDVLIYTNHFGDLGSSRNFSVENAHGKYITFIDADDLMSEQWLIRAYHFLETHTFGDYVAHAEFTLEFGGADSLVIKHGETDKDTDTLLSVFANRWNSIIMAPRQLLIEEPYTPNSPGYGYEDWHLNCRFIARGIHNVLIPETVIFVRRKDSDSEWLRQKTSYAVLPTNPLFTFHRIRELVLPVTSQATEVSTSLRPGRVQKLKRRGIGALRRVPTAERVARKIYGHYRRTMETNQRPVIPSWLVTEWRSMHDIEKRLFPSQHLLNHIPIYDSLTPEHYKTGLAYKKLVDPTTQDHYDYILFVPWLLKGGADRVSINYANTIALLRQNKHVLVVATLPVASEWSEQLTGADFMPFGIVTNGLTQDVKLRLLEQIIENSGATYLHIINSELGYDFAETHRNYLQATGKKLIVTSFSQSNDETGRVFGYSHTHVPKVYEQSIAVTTDNWAVTKMWAAEYGFDPERLIVHHQPVITPEHLNIPARPRRPVSLRILWAARLSPEKQPAIVGDIGRLLQGENVVIDMYGTPDHGFDVSFLRSLPPNVHYKGSFDGFFSLPLDHYDAYLYTSLFDGMPNAVLEAALAQLPIISSGVGGVPDFICNEQDGLVVSDLRSAEKYAADIRKLLQQPETLELYARNLHKKLLSRHSPRSYQESVEAFLSRIGY